MDGRILETGRTDLGGIVTAIWTILPGELYALDLSNTHNTHSYSALAHCAPVQNLPHWHLEFSNIFTQPLLQISNRTLTMTTRSRTTKSTVSPDSPEWPEWPEWTESPELPDSPDLPVSLDSPESQNHQNEQNHRNHQIHQNHQIQQIQQNHQIHQICQIHQNNQIING